MSTPLDLTGLVVAQNPHHTLSVLYGKILRTLQNMPQDAAYRRYTEEIIKELKFCSISLLGEGYPNSKNVSIVDKWKNLLSKQRMKLTLSRKMQAWKPWDTLVSEPPANQWKWPI
uniref:NADH dehydrogenase [ubiquinone] 1 alpha subcomplex subunit 5 n=1 Tax=Daphnia galeata TaxID=27404 RepID=A0A8J2RQ94_9CRUS|nr:unnamed protein product [Daphnia galeata]